MTGQTSKVFYPRVPWLGAGAQGIASSTRHKRTTNGSEDRDTSSQGIAARNFQQKTRTGDRSTKRDQTSNMPRSAGVSSGQYPWYCPKAYSPIEHFAAGWSPGVLSRELEAGYLRPMDLAGSSRMSLGTTRPPKTREAPQTDSILKRPGSAGLRRDPEAEREISNQIGSPKTRPVHQPDLPCPQKGRISAPGNQPEATEPLYSK